jgi:SAM-dependent methyltransferase
MSSAAARASDSGMADRRDEDLERLAGYIRGNRFLPVPPSEKNFVGDGDFVAVGVEFLKWFVRVGELAPQDRVLDIGCGIGRMALPLTQYLETGTYDGIDVSAEGIAWCAANISPHYGNFHFHHLDLAHPLYNPSGVLQTSDVKLPFEAGAFDFIFMTSVITHLTAAEVRPYVREIKRLLAPGGRCLVTTFMLNGPAREGLQAGRGVLPFDGAATEHEIYAYADNPTAAVAFDENFLLSIFLEFGLRRTRPPIYGRWSGRSTPGDSFQDINVLQAAASAG